jgi:hypothetical protein
MHDAPPGGVVAAGEGGGEEGDAGAAPEAARERHQGRESRGCARACVCACAHRASDRRPQKEAQPEEYSTVLDVDVETVCQKMSRDELVKLNEDIGEVRVSVRGAAHARVCGQPALPQLLV